MGGTPNDSPERDPSDVIRPRGNVKHEVGSAIMGNDPKTSVANAHCRAWDVPKLFFVDGAPFCSNADKNPTLTIMALAWRTADHVLAEMSRRNL
jgi:choline dehydrogenase-like flavoprotein